MPVFEKNAKTHPSEPNNPPFRRENHHRVLTIQISCIGQKEEHVKEQTATVLLQVYQLFSIGIPKPWVSSSHWLHLINFTTPNTTNTRNLRCDNIHAGKPPLIRPHSYGSHGCHGEKYLFWWPRQTRSEVRFLKWIWLEVFRKVSYLCLSYWMIMVADHENSIETWLWRISLNRWNFRF